jgi:hypothetical protein
MRFAIGTDHTLEGIGQQFSVASLAIAKRVSESAGLTSD